MAVFKLMPPWDEFYNTIRALFDHDHGVRVIYDEEHKDIKLYVEDNDKAIALAKILPTERVFGNTKVKLTIVPANKIKKTANSDDDMKAVFETAFKDNDALSYVHKVEGIMGFDALYVVFVNKVVQYYTDNLGDINGFHSTLYENIAREVFENFSGVFYCTDVPSNLGVPLGEWP